MSEKPQPPSAPNPSYGETPAAGMRPLDVDTIRRAETQPPFQSGSVPPTLISEVNAQREKYAKGVKQKLAATTITELEARDGLRDCFVASYLGGVAQGLDNFNLRGDVRQVENVVEAIFRRRLKAHGTTWETPTVHGLQSVKDEIDVETHMNELPPELKSIHDQVCTLLIGKARGDVGHVGDRSVVKAQARGENVTTPPQPAAPAAPAPAATAEDPVAVQMRQTVAILLDQMAKETREGASVEALFERAGQLTGLIDTLQRLSRR